MPSPPHKSRRREFITAVGAHLRKAEFIVYSSLLIVGGVQIVIRERFPNVHPPWPAIAVALVVLLLAMVLVPPLLLLMRVRKKRASETDERQS